MQMYCEGVSLDETSFFYIIAQPYNLIDRNDIFICDSNYREYKNPSMPHLEFRPLADTYSGVAVVWKWENTKKELQQFVKLIREQGNHIRTEL